MSNSDIKSFQKIAKTIDQAFLEAHYRAIAKFQ